MSTTGPRGPIGRVGDQGRIGDAGPTGDTGPAGEAGAVGEHGVPGPKGMSGNVAADRRLLFAMIWGVLAFLFLAGVVLWNQYRIGNGLERVDRNSHSIQMLFYDQCTAGNATTARQNALIDRIIDAEKRRTKPSAKTIGELAASKGKPADCGPKP